VYFSYADFVVVEAVVVLPDTFLKMGARRNSAENWSCRILSNITCRLSQFIYRVKNL